MELEHSAALMASVCQGMLPGLARSSKQLRMARRAKEAQWLDDSGNFNYQKWNVTAKKLEVDEARKSLSQDPIVTHISHLAEMSTPRTITKFNAKKRQNE